MSELSDMVQAAAAAARAGWPAAAATVVRVEGSAYRRPGARLLVTDDGRRIGSISGGCLEGDVVRHAAALTPGEAVLLRYDTASDEGIVAEFGLGCRGLIEVLLERLPAAGMPHPLAIVHGWEAAGHSGVLARVIRADGPAAPAVAGWLALDEKGGPTHANLPPEWVALLAAEASDAARAGEHRWARHDLAGGGGSADVFYEVARPPLRLVVAGAGHDAVPLVRIAKELGWHVTVVDRRSALANAARFPAADGIAVAARREELPAAAMAGRPDAAVIMTHSYLDDYELLRALLPAPRVRYVGLLGPRDRTARLLADMADEGTPPPPEQLSKLYAPVGLDIGADTPAQIALAVVAEVQCALAGRAGSFLRERPGPIHERRPREHPASVERKRRAPDQAGPPGTAVPAAKP